jgi:hypothetical protein
MEGKQVRGAANLQQHASGEQKRRQPEAGLLQESHRDVKPE